ncbi:MAG: hypothetical protein ACR2NN_17800 [Bryobacteraceae bacterium]
MNRRARQILVDGLQVRLLAEDNVGGIFALIHAPVVSACEIPIDRAAPPGELIQPCMYPFRFPSAGDALSPLPVPDMGESVVRPSIIDSPLAQLARQLVVAVETDL